MNIYQKLKVALCGKPHWRLVPIGQIKHGDMLVHDTRCVTKVNLNVYRGYYYNVHGVRCAFRRVEGKSNA